MTIFVWTTFKCPPVAVCVPVRGRPCIIYFFGYEYDRNIWSWLARKLDRGPPIDFLEGSWKVIDRSGSIECKVIVIVVVINSINYILNARNLACFQNTIKHWKSSCAVIIERNDVVSTSSIMDQWKYKEGNYYADKLANLNLIVTNYTWRNDNYINVIMNFIMNKPYLFSLKIY